ncbi:MAG: dihydroorotate dehydrogenase electron transfer subunit [Clostridia bacterium]|jgi:dihydroorotate dehydrogenase electron transfer subunit
MKRYRGKVMWNQAIAQGIYEMAIECSDLDMSSFIPGQFIHIRIPRAAHLLLRRPISVNRFERQGELLIIVYQVKGEGTNILSKAQVNEEIDFLGPLGNGFFIPTKVHRVFIVGGGIGIAPLRYCLDFWGGRTFYSFLGFRKKEYAYMLDDFYRYSKDLWVTSEDGSIGEKGLVIQALERVIKEGVAPELILACGPKPMLSALQTIAQKYGIPCQISLEERMGCGIGGCLVCSCKVKKNGSWTYQRVCGDGPVFDSREVILDE